MRPDLVRFASTKAAPAASSGWGSWFTPQGTMNAVMTSLAMVFSFKLVGQVRFCFRSLFALLPRLPTLSAALTAAARARSAAGA